MGLKKKKSRKNRRAKIEARANAISNESIQAAPEDKNDVAAEEKIPEAAEGETEIVPEGKAEDVSKGAARDASKDTIVTSDSSGDALPVHKGQEMPPRKTAPLWTAVLFLLVAIAGVSTSVYLYRNYAASNMDQDKVTKASVVDSIISQGYYPLAPTMEAIGFRTYIEGNLLSYVKTISGVTVTLNYNFDNNICIKKGYSFDLTDKWLEYEGEYYLQASLIEEITNFTPAVDAEGTIVANEVKYDAGDWVTAHSPLIARAGGAIRKLHGNQTHSNGLVALIQNYDLGHRVFELDLQKTSDGGVAAVYGNMVERDEEGILMEQAEWKQYGGLGKITPLLIGDVLDQMAINQDMFLVTDTSPDAASLFKVILDEASTRDKSLMDRVIPQVYSRKMYNELMKIYDFPSMIFATYRGLETNPNALNISKENDNIHVISVDHKREFNVNYFLSGTENTDMVIFAHTVNTYEDLAILNNKGVYGLYTDIILPYDMNVYDHIRRVAEENETSK